MLEETLFNDLKTSMKAQDSVKVSTLRLIIAAIKNLRIEKQIPSLEDQDVISLLKKQAKQRADSIEQYDKANRSDLSNKERAELEIVNTYLPQQLSEGAIASIVKETITKLQATEMKDMGSVMKAIQEKTQGAADNKIVSQMVRNALS